MTGKEYNNQFSDEEIATEIWKDIPNFEYYQISNLGRARSLPRVFIKSNGRLHRVGLKILIPGLSICGKFHVSLYREKTNYLIYIHRLVLLTFVSPCPDGMEVCHNDGNKINNRLENLRWDTHISNCEDKKRHGTYQYGERIGNHKLTEQQVIDIISLINENKESISSIAKMFSVDVSMIYYIKKGISWKHLNYLVNFPNQQQNAVVI